MAREEIRLLTAESMYLFGTQMVRRREGMKFNAAEAMLEAKLKQAAVTSKGHTKEADCNNAPPRFYSICIFRSHGDCFFRTVFE